MCDCDLTVEDFRLKDLCIKIDYAAADTIRSAHSSSSGTAVSGIIQERLLTSSRGFQSALSVSTPVVFRGTQAYIHTESRERGP